MNLMNKYETARWYTISPKFEPDARESKRWTIRRAGFFSSRNKRGKLESHIFKTVIYMSFRHK